MDGNARDREAADGRPGAAQAGDLLAASLRLTVENLASGFGERPGSDPQRLQQVASWILERLRSAGCAAHLQPFEVRGLPYWNVVAEVPGTAGHSPGLLLGAHYDTERGTPGADDNASGVAVLLELARLLARKPAAARVRLVAFCLEEMPYYASEEMGSAACVRALQQAGDLPSGMLSLEMLGYFSDQPDSQQFPFRFFRWIYPEKANFIAFVSDLGAIALNRRAQRAFRSAVDLPAEMLSAPAFVPGVDFSDHRSFRAAGVPAIMVTDTAFYRNPNYHSASDAPETLDYARMAKAVVGLEAVVRAF